MSNKNVYFLLFFMVFSGCHVMKTSTINGAANKDTVTFHPKYLQSDSNTLTRLQCNEFVTEAFDNYTINDVGKKFIHELQCNKELFVNLHDSATIDTVYTFSNAENKIQFYRAKLNDFLFKFDVTDSIYKLNGNIRTGMSKDLFSKRFAIAQNLSNKVQITNTDGSIKLTFYFENNLLKRIHTYLYLD